MHRVKALLEEICLFVPEKKSKIALTRKISLKNRKILQLHLLNKLRFRLLQLTSCVISKRLAKRFRRRFWKIFPKKSGKKSEKNQNIIAAPPNEQTWSRPIQCTSPPSLKRIQPAVSEKKSKM